MGSVYFLQEAPSGPIKIGFTLKDIRERLISIQTHNSRELNLLGSISPASKLDERDWHIRFANARCRGEWFWPVAELLAAISAEAAPAEPWDRLRRKRRIPTDWVLTFDRWLEDHGMDAVSFGRFIGVAETTLSAVRHGKVPTQSLAKRIELATGGAVPASLVRREAA